MTEKQAIYPARLILVRHGETDWNHQGLPQGLIDVPLNDTGREQGRALAKRLKSMPIDALFSSDLARAAETATILGQALDLTPQLSAAWREIDLGSWGGLTRPEIEARFPDELAALERGEDVARGGGETMAAVQERVVAEFERISELHQGQTVAVVSHGGTLKGIICHLLGLELRYLNRLTAGGNTGLSIFEFGWGLPHLVLLNDTSHLDGRSEN